MEEIKMTDTLRRVLIREMPFKSRSGLVELCAVPTDHEYRTDETDPFWPELVVRLVLWAEIETASVPIHQILDVKEQRVYIRPLEPALRDHGGRNTNFVQALRTVLQEISDDTMATLVPADVMCFAPLARPSFGTVEEFVTSLRRKSNLGKYL